MQLALNTYTTPYCKTSLDVLNNLLLKDLKLQYSEILVHPKCPQAILDYIKDRLDYTVPKLASRYPDNPCMIWLGATDRDEYARHSIPSNLKRYGGNYAGLHRYVYAWLVHGGKLPDMDSKGNKIEVHHDCGNRSCVNVNHLMLLPAQQNKKLGNPQKLQMGL